MTKLMKLLAGQSDEPLPIPRTRHGAIGCMVCEWRLRKKARTGWARGPGKPVILTTCEPHEPKNSLFVFAVRFA
jgi:hypothetical protein